MTINVDLARESGELVMKAIEITMVTADAEKSDCVEPSGEEFFQK